MSKVTNILQRIDCGDNQKLRKHIKEYVRSSCTNQSKIVCTDRFNNNQYDAFVRCGSCDNCRNTHSNELYTRMYLDALMLEHAYFVTLTYKSYDSALEVPDKLKDAVYHYDAYNDTNNLCYSPCLLSYNHVQAFIKRLRVQYLRKYGITPFIEYFVAGEYGHKFGRPHWHIIFLCDVEIRAEDFNKAWSIDRERIGKTEVDDLFENGTMRGERGLNSKKCFKYVAKYASKRERDFNKTRLYFAYNYLIKGLTVDIVPASNNNKQLLLYYETNDLEEGSYMPFNEFTRIFNQRTQSSTGHALGCIYYARNAERFVSGNTALHLPNVATDLATALERNSTLSPLTFPQYYRIRINREKERFRIFRKTDNESTCIGKILYKDDIRSLLALTTAAPSFLHYVLPGIDHSVTAEDFGDFKDLPESLQRGIALFVGSKTAETYAHSPYIHYRYSALFDSVTREHYRLEVSHLPDGTPFSRFRVLRYSKQKRRYYFLRYESVENIYNMLQLSYYENAKDWNLTLASISANTKLQDWLKHNHEAYKMYVAEIAENIADWQRVRTKKLQEHISNNRIL